MNYVEERKISRMSKAQFLLFLDIFVKLKLNENKSKDSNNNSNDNDNDKTETGEKIVTERADEKSSNILTENLSDCSVRCFKEYSNLLGLDVTNYQAVYFSRLAGAIIRDSGNLKSHSEEERNNFNVFLNSESGSGLKNILENRENKDESKVKSVENGEGIKGDVCGCENRVKPFPSFSEGIKVLEFFSGIGCDISVS
jgi:hypothetical protein